MKHHSSLLIYSKNRFLYSLTKIHFLLTISKIELQTIKFTSRKFCFSIVLALFLILSNRDISSYFTSNNIYAFPKDCGFTFHAVSASTVSGSTILQYWYLVLQFFVGMFQLFQLFTFEKKSYTTSYGYRSYGGCLSELVYAYF